MDVLEGGVTKGVFALDITSVASDPNHDTIKVPLDLWHKETGQLALEVWARDRWYDPGADLVDERVHPLFA